MAKFLDGPGVQASITDLIKNTERELFIISPYLKISTMMKNYLKSIDSRNIPISITYRPPDSNINDGDLTFFTELNHLKLYQCDNLHSKCFINEKEGVITSMNFHEHSQTHNWEMGIKFSRQDDSQIFSDVTKELRLMGTQMKLQSLAKKVAEPQQKYHIEPSQKPHQKPLPKPVFKPTEAPNKGLITKILDKVTGEAAYCIRCGKPMAKFDLQKPYCDGCYTSWARYKNPQYKEKFCHGCGSDTTKSRISFEKPTCKSCYTEYFKK
jgi:hypothetical protein